MRTRIIEFDWTAWEAEVLDRLRHHGTTEARRVFQLPLLQANRLALERAATAAERSPGQPGGATEPTVNEALNAAEVPPAGGACEAQGPVGEELFAAVRRHGDARFDTAMDSIAQRVRAHGEWDIVIASFYREVREYLLWGAPGQPQLWSTEPVERGDGWVRTVLRLGAGTVTCWMTGGLLPEEARARAGLVLHYEVPHILTAFGQRLERLGRVGREHVFVVPTGAARERLEQYMFSRALGG